MGNRSYLCCCDHPDIYPSFGYRDFEATLHTLAAGSYAVPITWLAMFGSNSLVTRAFETGDGDVSATAPIASRELCLERLRGGISRIEEAFGWQGKLSEYEDCLRELLESTLGEYVSIEIQEIACLSNSEEEFYDAVRKALLWIDGSDESSGGEAVVSFVDFDVARPIYPPKGIYSRDGLDQRDFQNAISLIGGAHVRNTPWDN